MSTFARELQALTLPQALPLEEGPARRPDDRPYPRSRQHALGQYDRLNDPGTGEPDRPTYIREARRTKGRPSAHKAVSRPDQPAVKADTTFDSTRWERLIDECAKLSADIASSPKPRVLAALQAELDRRLSELLTLKGTENVPRDIRNLLVSRRQYRVHGAPRNPGVQDRDYKKRIAAEHAARLSESSDRGW